MLSGDNGVLQRATDAKEQTEIGQEKEIVALAYNSALAKKVSNSNSDAVTDSELNKELKGSGATARGNNPIIVTFDNGNSYSVYNNGEINEYTPPQRITVAQAKSEGTVFNSNTTLIDDYENEVVVPKGFKIAPGENGSSTAVTGGIVIEDMSTETLGNQFVWIPIGSGIKKSASETVEITLGRYTFDTSNGTPTLVQNASKTDYSTGVALGISSYGNTTNFYEYVTNPEGTEYENIKAKALGSFISSAIDNGGYYIARYEAGIDGETDQYNLAGYNIKSDYSGSEPTDSTKVIARDGSVKPVIKSGAGVWNAVTQPEAATISRNMYTNLNSDLANSYAWDTAIAFIQKCGTNANYANKNALQSSLTTTGNASDGTNNDKQCNIYDMAGNIYEWTTETSLGWPDSCTNRGGLCYYNGSFTAFRNCNSSVYSDDTIGFRPILYF